MPRDGNGERPRAAGPASARLLAASASGVGCSALLWTLGRLATPRGGWLAALLAAALALGLALVCGSTRSRRAGRADRRLAGLAGWGSLAAVAAFLATLFAVPEGPVPIIRRAPDAEPPAEELRLVDWNVLHGYPELSDQEARYRRLAAALRALDPTVVVLQEAWSTTRHGQLAERLAAELGMSFAYARANGSRRLIGFEEGSAVLSRLPILEARSVALSPRRPLWERRIALFATLEWRGALTVVGTHLASRDSEVAGAQARDLARRLPEGLVIVAGDLNAPSGSAATAAFAARGLIDLVPGGIDHVLISPLPSGLVARADWTLDPASTRVSDHPGIVVDLAVVPVADR